MNSRYKHRVSQLLLAASIGSLGSLWAGEAGGDLKEGVNKRMSLAPRIDQIEVIEPRSFDGNEWFILVRNDGNWANYPEEGDLSGGVWPRGSGKNTIFGSGIWIGAVVNEEVRVSAVQHSSSFAAGPIHEGGVPADPSNPAYRVYKVNRWDSTGVADWDEWPDSLGAPVDTAGNSYIPIDQTLFTVYNDLSGFSELGSTPLGAEVRQTIYGGITAGTSGLNRP
jgi:hypothetical protein